MDTVAVFSGGLDSTVLLYHLRQGLAPGAGAGAGGDRPARLLALLFPAGLPAAGRRKAAALCDGMGISCRVCEDPPIPASGDPPRVQNRNMIRLSITAAYAMADGYDRIAFAAHQGDAAYQDCKPEFVEMFSRCLSLAAARPLALHVPFLGKVKRDIVLFGNHLGVDWSATWSCYEGGARHCGRCRTCQERREAFILAGVADPTEYESQMI